MSVHCPYNHAATFSLHTFFCPTLCPTSSDACGFLTCNTRCLSVAVFLLDSAVHMLLLCLLVLFCSYNIMPTGSFQGDLQIIAWQDCIAALDRTRVATRTPDMKLVVRARLVDSSTTLHPNPAAAKACVDRRTEVYSPRRTYTHRNTHALYRYL